ncbi:MAG: response regulator [Pirellulales bacterium]
MRKVLLVEDNETNQDLIVRFLSLLNFDVAWEGNGLDGVERIRREPDEFDVILMDMSLPELDGWEATRRLKSDPATKHLPIIALTAHAMTGDREKCLEAGCDDYATKPIDFHSLCERIELLLAKDAE